MNSASLANLSLLYWVRSKVSGAGVGEVTTGYLCSQDRLCIEGMQIVIYSCGSLIYSIEDNISVDLLGSGQVTRYYTYILCT